MTTQMPRTTPQRAFAPCVTQFRAAISATSAPETFATIPGTVPPLFDATMGAARHGLGRFVAFGASLIALQASATLAPSFARAAELPYFESFDLPDGEPWPAPWFVGGAHVTVADVQGGRARLNGDPAFVARMILPDYSEVDAEVLVTFEFEDVANQGIGFYVRQNGGTLEEYEPHGQGYAMFLKGNWIWPEDLGIWREIDGVETQFATGNDPIAGGLQNGVRYRLRFRVTQLDAGTTLLQARVWPEAESEPVEWTLESTDDHPDLQGTAGSFAADIYNFSGISHIFLDDLSIVPAGDTSGLVDSERTSSLRLDVWPHPLRDHGQVRLDLPASGPATLRVVDVSGRSVDLLFAGDLSAGVSTLPWTLRRSQGRPLPEGVYFLHLDAGRVHTSRRIVVAGR